MKRLVNAIVQSLRNFFNSNSILIDEDTNVLWVSIPKTFKTKKDQNYMIRRTKDFIIENTEVG